MLRSAQMALWAALLLWASPTLAQEEGDEPAPASQPASQPAAPAKPKEAAKPPAQKEPPEVAKARKAFHAGKQALLKRRNREALIQFRKAYELTKDERIMGHIALVYEQAGDYRGAIKALKQYREALPASEHGAIDLLIKRFEERLGGGAGGALDLEGAGGKVPEKEEKPGISQLRLWTWISAGAAVALGISALSMGISAKSSFDSLEATCSPSCPADEVDSVRTRSIVADALLGATVATAATAVVLYIFDARARAKLKREKEEAEKTASFRIGPGGLGLQLAF